MKLLLLALFVGLATAAPTDDKNEPLEVIVNGVPEGEPLEIDDILEVKLKELVNGQVVSSSNALFPYTAEGMAEQQPEDIVDPKPVVPELPGDIWNPKPVVPELPEDIIDPKPIVPELPVVPEPETPEAIPPVVVLPEVPETPIQPEEPEMVQPEAPVEAPNGDLFNNGVVQVQMNAENSGVLSSIQSWFSMVVNYFNGAETTTEQIV